MSTLLVCQEGELVTVRMRLVFVFLGVFFSIQVGAATSPFLIPPYLFSIKGQQIAVSWSYNKTYQVPGDVSAYLEKNGQIVKVPAAFNNGLFSAILPIPTCGYGDDLEYAVTGMDAPGKINNIPCPGDPETVRFSFMADSQEGYSIAGEFAKLIGEFHGAALLHGGDLVQTGDSYKEWVELLNALSPAIGSQVLIPALGNHEYRYNNQVPAWKYFFRTDAATAYYAVDIGPVHVIALNSCFEDDPSLRFVELSWLQEELSKPARWRVIFFHHPAYSKGFLNSEMSPRKEYEVLQQDYVPVFEHYKVDLVLNGHTHIFERSLKDGIQYLTTGPAGGKMGVYGAKNPYSLMSDRIRTIVEFEANDEALRAVTTSIEGKTIDEFTLHKQ